MLDQPQVITESLSALETLGRPGLFGSKPNRVRHAILAHIHSRAMRSGDQMPSERRLAHELGVSRMTLRKGLGSLVEKGFLCRVHGKGVFVRAQRPPSARVTKVAVLYQDKYNYENSYLGRLIPALETALGGQGFQFAAVPTKTTDDSWMRHSEVIEQWRRGKLFGVILASHYPTLQVLNLAATGIPYVWVGNSLGIEPTHSILTDSVGGFFRSIQLLLAGGRAGRRIYVIGYSMTEPLQLWCRHVVDAGCLSADRLVFQRLTSFGADSHAEIRGFLCSIAPPAGIFVDNYFHGQIVIEQLRERNLRVPEDASVVVQNVDATVSHHPLTPTMLNLPFREMAKAAVRLLANVVNGECAPGESLYIPLELIPGETTPKEIAPSNGVSSPKQKEG